MGILEAGDIGTIVEAAAWAGYDAIEVEKLKNLLKSVVHQIDDDPFPHKGTINPSSFGGTFSGQNLSYHHGRAHDVMTQTLKGYLQDLHDFATGINKAVSDFDLSDAGTNATVKRQEAVLSALDQFNKHHHARTNANHARNHPWHQPKHNAGGGS